MPFLLQVDGPALSREWLLEESSGALTVGRDPGVPLHLPDPERALSRRHLSLTAGPEGVQATVLSSVNGATTNQGMLAPGQSARLVAGDSISIGAYTIRIAAPGAARTVPSSEPAPVSAPWSGGGVPHDPFAAILGGPSNPAGSSGDVFLAAGMRPAPAPPAVVGDPFQSLLNQPDALATGRTGLSGSLHPFGEAAHRPTPGSGAHHDPLSLLGGSTGSAGAVPGVSGTGMDIDAWLGAGAPPAQATAVGRLAVDHVHDLNLPFTASPSPGGRPPGSLPPAMEGALPPAGTGAMPWPPADTQRPGAVSPAAPWPPASAAPATTQRTSSASPPLDIPDFDALFSSPAAGDPFGDTSWLGGASAAPEFPVSGATGTNALAAAPAPAYPSGSAAPPVGHPVQGTPQSSPGASPAPARAAHAFARGLGINQMPVLDDAAWERMGTTVRLVVEGLIDLLNARAELKRELRVDDRTMLASRDNNPLKTGLDLQSALQYLLVTPSGMAGYKAADAALREAVQELRVHELATVAASRAAVEGALHEFDPEVLRKQLADGKSRLSAFAGNGRLWDAYVERYSKQSEHMADWLEKIFARHFVPAYSKETERLKGR